MVGDGGEPTASALLGRGEEGEQGSRWKVPDEAFSAQAHLPVGQLAQPCPSGGPERVGHFTELHSLGCKPRLPGCCCWSPSSALRSWPGSCKRVGHIRPFEALFPALLLSPTPFPCAGSKRPCRVCVCCLCRHPISRLDKSCFSVPG